MELLPHVEIVCSIQANLEAAFRASPTIIGKDGRKYRDVAVRVKITDELRRATEAFQYEICLSFSETELAARIRWKASVRQLQLQNKVIYLTSCRWMRVTQTGSTVAQSFHMLYSRYPYCTKESSPRASSYWLRDKRQRQRRRSMERTAFCTAQAACRSSFVLR
jgi:hypothetical protein